MQTAVLEPRPAQVVEKFAAARRVLLAPRRQQHLMAIRQYAPARQHRLARCRRHVSTPLDAKGSLSRPSGHSASCARQAARASPTHASLGYKPPAPEVFMPAYAAWPAALLPTTILSVLPKAHGSC